jgi:hypothetical protein
MSTPKNEQKPAGAVRSTVWLGSSGYIFLDDQPWPYAVKEYHSGWWLHRWSDAIKGFITLRALSQAEVDAYRHRALPPEKAALYLPNVPAQRPPATDV